MSTEQAQKKNYKETLNLPQTSFPMEAKLVTNEPKRLEMWKETRLYDKVLSARASAPKRETLEQEFPAPSARRRPKTERIYAYE